MKAHIFLIANLKFRLQTPCSFGDMAENVKLIGIPINNFFCIYIIASSPGLHTFFCLWRVNKKLPQGETSQNTFQRSRWISWKCKIHMVKWAHPPIGKICDWSMDWHSFLCFRIHLYCRPIKVHFSWIIFHCSIDISETNQNLCQPLIYDLWKKMCINPCTSIFTYTIFITSVNISHSCPGGTHIWKWRGCADTTPNVGVFRWQTK